MLPLSADGMAYVGFFSSFMRSSGPSIPVVEIPEAVDPRCPHCGAPLTAVAARELRVGLGVATIYCCPECLKSLGVSHRKGFWMG